MMFTRANDIKLEIPRAAIEAIFDECDRYNVDETGGRILGTYNAEGRDLRLTVNGVIEPGPNAQRTQTYFKQDGEYQEDVFPSGRRTRPGHRTSRQLAHPPREWIAAPERWRHRHLSPDC